MMFLDFGAPAENRTPDTLIKSQVLYQLSYRGILLSFCFAKMRRICYAGKLSSGRSAIDWIMHRTPRYARYRFTVCELRTP